MTAARRRPAFDPDALGDIDDLLPVMPSEPRRGAVQAGPDVLATQPDAQLEPSGGAGDQRPVRGRSTEVVASARPQLQSSARIKPPEVALAPTVYGALRRITLNERATSPTTARSYGRVALDAIEAHADELQEHWRVAPPPTGGLFTRTDLTARQRRRRHSEAPARVPLAGIVASDVTQLDRLAEQWGAGSRSSLVEEALRRYLGVSDVAHR